MLRATAKRLTAAKLDPLTRAQMDMFASHVLTNETSFSPVKTSEAAKEGQVMRGDVALPVELRQAVLNAINVLEDKSLLRQRALDLYEHFRKTATESGFASTKTLPPHDELTSLAHLTGVMPAMYAAIEHVLRIARARAGDDNWTPDKVIDFGSGTGSAAWAVDQVWSSASIDYVGLESSKAMTELSNALFQALPSRAGRPDGEQEQERADLDAKAHLMSMPASESTLAKLQLAPHQNRGALALSAFALGSLSTAQKRREAVRSMWDSGAPVIVVIERGTPAGSRLVLDAREQLLAYGRREGASGSHVVAPCPHDGECPLHQNAYAFCHFSQRLQTPSFLRETKASTKGENDSKFSYIIIKRGERPVAQIEATAQVNESTDQLIDPKRTDLSAHAQQGPSSSWPRIISPPRKASRHVVLEVCAPSQQIERHLIPKSQGRQAYYDARKAAWGDAFPHAPKNGPQLAPAMKKALADEEAGLIASRMRGDDSSGGDGAATLQRVTNKFAGSSERRAKKAERRQKAWKRELEEMDPSMGLSLSRRRSKNKRQTDDLPANGKGGIIDEFDVFL